MDGWRRVKRGHECPICKSDSWCTVSGDGQVVRCMRTKSDRPAPGKDGADGWLHRTDGATVSLPPVTPIAARIDADAIHSACQRDLPLSRAVALANRLGVTLKAIEEMGLGWHYGHSCYTFPMCDHKRQVIGIRTRDVNGNKRAIRGSRNGLFIPQNMVIRGPLLVPEGPTDAAALRGLGYCVIGRPDCRGGGNLLIALLNRERVRPLVVVVSDTDAPGMEGASLLVDRLRTAGIPAKMILPPEGCKDAREWVNRGATTRDIDETIYTSGLISQTVPRDRTAKKPWKLNWSKNGQAERSDVAAWTDPGGL